MSASGGGNNWTQRHLRDPIVNDGPEEEASVVDSAYKTTAKGMAFALTSLIGWPIKVALYTLIWAWEIITTGKARSKWRAPLNVAKLRRVASTVAVCTLIYLCWWAWPSYLGPGINQGYQWWLGRQMVESEVRPVEYLEYLQGQPRVVLEERASSAMEDHIWVSYFTQENGQPIEHRVDYGLVRVKIVGGTDIPQPSKHSAGTVVLVRKTPHQRTVTRGGRVVEDWREVPGEKPGPVIEAIFYLSPEKANEIGITLVPKQGSD